jgi:hypothetical protein
VERPVQKRIDLRDSADGFRLGSGPRRRAPETIFRAAPDAREFALEYRVVLLFAENGVPIDVSLGAIAYEDRVVARASEFVLEPGAAIATCSAEDLIVLKAFAAREKDWLDIEGVLVRQRGRLDEDLIWSELHPLLELKGEPGIGDRLRSLIARSAD